MTDFTYHVNDTLVIEVAHVARQLGLTDQNALSYLVGLGMATLAEMGAIGPRAVTIPADLIIVELERLAAELRSARDST